MTTIGPLDVDYHTRVQVPGWYGTHLAIGAEDMGDGWVKVLWEMCSWSVGPYTMFKADEKLLLA